MTVRQARRKVVRNLIDDSTVLNINTRRDAVGMTSDKLALLAGIDVEEMKCSPYMHTNSSSDAPPSGNMHGGGGGGNGGGNDSDTPAHTTSGGSGGDAVRKRKIASSRVGRMSGPVGVASKASPNRSTANGAGSVGDHNGGRRERRVHKSLSRHKTLDDANDLMQHPTFPAVMDAAQVCY